MLNSLTVAVISPVDDLSGSLVKEITSDPGTDESVHVSSNEVIYMFNAPCLIVLNYIECNCFSYIFYRWLLTSWVRVVILL